MFHENLPPDPVPPNHISYPSASVWRYLLVLVLMTSAAYGSSFLGVFVLDDLRCLEHGEGVSAFFPAPEAIAPGLRNRPVVRLTFAANYALHGRARAGYHAVNLFIHLAAAMLLFDLARRAVIHYRPDGNPTNPTRLAFTIALLWAVHPLCTQAVTYIIQRIESLMAACYLGVLLALIRGATARTSWPWYLLAVALCALGMGTKEVMITAPIVAMLFDRAIISQSWNEVFRRRWGLYLLLATTWAISIVQIQMAFRTKDNAHAGFNIQISPIQYLRTQPEVIWHYLRLALVPYPLCFDYQWPVEQSLFWSAIFGLPLLALLVYFLIGLQKWPVVGFCGLAFFLVLAPTSSIMPIKDMAVEHRMYLPLACVITLVVLAVDCVWRRYLFSISAGEAESRRQVRLWTYGTLVLGIALTFMTFERNLVYHSALSVWSDTAAKAATNARAHDFVGVELLQLKRYDEAIAEFSTALEMGDTTPQLRFNRGTAYLESKQWELAVVEFDAAEALKSGVSIVAINRARAHHELSHFSKAVADYSRVIEAHPDHTSALYFRGLSLQQLGDHPAAIRDFSRCIELAAKIDLSDPAARAARAKSYRTLGDIDRAQQDETAAESANSPDKSN